MGRFFMRGNQAALPFAEISPNKNLMDDFEKLSVLRPFGPSVGEFNVKEEFVNDLNEYLKLGIKNYEVKYEKNNSE